MTKVIQGLAKRTGEIRYVPEGAELPADPFAIGDTVSLSHKSGAVIQVKVSAIQDGSTLIGTLIDLSDAVPGVAVGDIIVEHADYVHMVNRD